MKVITNNRPDGKSLELFPQCETERDLLTDLRKILKHGGKIRVDTGEKTLTEYQVPTNQEWGTI